MIRPVSGIVFAVFLIGCAGATASEPRGFAGYAFHSHYDAIVQDMDRAGYDLLDADDHGLWYSGALYGYPVEFFYEFSDFEMVGGFIDVLVQSEEAWHSVQNQLRSTYPTGDSRACRSNDHYCRVLCTNGVKLVHLLTDDRKIHVVRYYERSPQNPCNTQSALDHVQEPTKLS